MRAIVVVSCELDEPEDVVAVIHAIDPPNVPHFAGKLRIAVLDSAEAVEAWLDDNPDSTRMGWPDGG